ncbi:LysR family transcriptional regulator [Streptomyces sp. NPDC057245]|uniref:LysR family transcriptional regulator n=1 Tax=Streptomyces TaxID=1883 RepID=UPI001C1E07D9|nr:LysR family transcriptional regulator [Streptomyces sp. A108]MBU6533288.1 LysR family transcriptional regulator [Streptomyces sp. A108]
MELQQLRVFREVAQELSFTRAARKLHCAQSTVTGQIKSLESSLGTSLFLRRGRCPIELTAAGALLQGRVDHILQAVDTTGREVRGVADRPAHLDRHRTHEAHPHAV